MLSSERCVDALLPLLFVFMFNIAELVLLRPPFSKEGDGAPGAGEADVEAELLLLPFVSPLAGPLFNILVALFALIDLFA